MRPVTLLAAVFAASTAYAASINYSQEQLSATAGTVSNTTTLVSSSNSISATDGTASATTAGSLSGSSFTFGLHAKSPQSDSASNVAAAVFTEPLNTTFTISGTLSIANTGGQDQFTIDLYDETAGGTDIWSYSTSATTVSSFAGGGGSLIAGDLYEFVETAQLGTPIGPSLAGAGSKLPSIDAVTTFSIPALTPEPGTMLLFGAGFACITLIGLRRRV